MSQMTDEYILSYIDDMEKAIDRLHNDYLNIRVGRANPKQIEKTAHRTAENLRK